MDPSRLQRQGAFGRYAQPGSSERAATWTGSPSARRGGEREKPLWLQTQERDLRRRRAVLRGSGRAAGSAGMPAMPAMRLLPCSPGQGSVQAGCCSPTPSSITSRGVPPLPGTPAAGQGASVHVFILWYIEPKPSGGVAQRLLLHQQREQAGRPHVCPKTGTASKAA